MSIAMDHIVLNVEKVDTMISFYRDILGLSAERLDEFRDGKVPFPSLRINEETIIDLFPKSMWEKSSPTDKARPNLNHFCLSLDKDEWDRLRGRLSEHHVEIQEGPVSRWGAHGTGISIYFLDPEGNVIEARYYKATDSSQPCLLGS